LSIKKFLNNLFSSTLISFISQLIAWAFASGSFVSLFFYFKRTMFSFSILFKSAFFWGIFFVGTALIILRIYNFSRIDYLQQQPSTSSISFISTGDIEQNVTYSYYSFTVYFDYSGRTKSNPYGISSSLYAVDHISNLRCRYCNNNVLCRRGKLMGYYHIYCSDGHFKFVSKHNLFTVKLRYENLLKKYMGTSKVDEILKNLDSALKEMDKNNF